MSASKPVRTLGYVVMGLSALWAVGLLVVFILRATFPLELEWMEGGSLHTAMRIQQRQPIYGEPNADFVPFLYTPGYPFVLAVLGKVFPLGYGLGRAVSILCTGLSCAAIWKIVTGEAGEGERHLAGPAAAVGLFLAGYVFAFRWMDVARNDSLYLCLVLWGMFGIRHAQGNPLRAALAGCAMGLAFWTKQTAVVFIFASGLGALLVLRLEDRKALAAYVATIGAIGLGGLAIGQSMSDGQLWEWIYERHQAHAFNKERFRKKTWGMFAHALPFELLAVALGGGGLIATVVRAQNKREALDGLRGPAFWTLVAGAGLLVSALGYSTQWAEPNAFLPGVAVLALLAGIAVVRIEAPTWIGLAIGGLVAAQLVFAAAVEPMYQPIQSKGRAGVSESYRWQSLARTVPSPKQRERARKLRQRLEHPEGPVFAFHKPWWSVLGGGDGHVGSMGLHDIDVDDRRGIQAAVAHNVADQLYAEVWVEGEPPYWLRRALSGSYRVGDRRQGKRRVRPLSGYMSDAGMVTKYRGDQVRYVPVSDDTAPDTVFDFEDPVGEFTFEGRAFSRRTTHGFVPKLPPAGPHRGARLWHSLGSRGEGTRTGSATSTPFVLEGDELTMRLATSGKRKGLRVEVVVADEVVHTFKPKKGRFRLRTVRWTLPAELRGASATLRFVDSSRSSGLYVDDVRLRSKG